MKLIIRTILFLSITVFLNLSYSEPLPIEDYDEISENIFWNDLYPGGGWSLYCGYRFENSFGVNEASKDKIVHTIQSFYMQA